jgi:hypothetical protein
LTRQASSEFVMPLSSTFAFRPLPELVSPIHFPFPNVKNPLGPLAQLTGKWSGEGFNVIWRPNNAKGQDRFLELNKTTERLEFDAIPGPIPNRGLLQSDINMFGVTYLQQISDTNLKAGLHIEPGIWVTVPQTKEPQEPPTVARLASIPHGTTVLAQGTAKSVAKGPAIDPVSIKPFPIGTPAQVFDFPEQTLATPTPFRTDAAGLVGVTQAMVDNPNSVLLAALSGQTILDTITLDVSTTNQPVAGGGTANTAFLAGDGTGPNADAVVVTSTFWLETVKGTPNFLQLQYTQTVMLNFNGLSWPHVTVGTLRKDVDITLPIQKIDPTLNGGANLPG